MKPERRRKLLIAILILPIVLAFAGGFLLTRLPYGFVSGAKLWFAQKNPSDPNEIWLFYAHPESPYVVIEEARKELATEPDHEFRILVPKGTEGSQTYDRRTNRYPVWLTREVDDSNIATNRASFLITGNTQVLIEVGNTKFDGSEMMGHTGRWPKDQTLIAIRRPASALDHVKAWMAGLQWQGLSASAETELFKGIENDRRVEDELMRKGRERMEEDRQAEARAEAKRAEINASRAQVP